MCLLFSQLEVPPQCLALGWTVGTQEGQPQTPTMRKPLAGGEPEEN